ncbi:MAG TPA: hypothetical protein VK923_09620 [Euzebyales bacterium]|nr:hypothetical protein [Euzebyales bacterium]
MIALGLAIELIAAVLVLIGLLLGAEGTGMLWSSIAVVLVGLLIAGAGVRRARPPSQRWTSSSATPHDTSRP